MSASDPIQQFEERKCLTCQGSGRSERDPLRKCDFCDGVGFVQRPKHGLQENAKRQCPSLHRTAQCSRYAGHEGDHSGCLDDGRMRAWPNNGLTVADDVMTDEQHRAWIAQQAEAYERKRHEERFPVTRHELREHMREHLNRRQDVYTALEDRATGTDSSGTVSTPNQETTP